MKTVKDLTDAALETHVHSTRLTSTPDRSESPLASWATSRFSNNYFVIIFQIFIFHVLSGTSTGSMLATS